MFGHIFHWILNLLSAKSGQEELDTSSQPSPSPPSSSHKESSEKEESEMNEKENEDVIPNSPLKEGHISQYFTYKEATHSNTAISRGMDNTPSPEMLETIKDTARRLDGVRELLGTPIIVSSWYRNAAVNKAVGGSSTSDHMSGKSVDFRADRYGSPLEICRAIVESDIEFDQLIFETNSRGSQWVHIGWGDRMRGEVLTKKPNKPYMKGLLA